MRILVYGDSNSWGYLDDGSGMRHDRRWPVVMAESLGPDITVIEECLPGRTSNADDPREGPHFNGATPLLPILMSHQPLDLVLIMLGTNDFKVRFNRSAEDISKGILELATIACHSGAGAGGWNANNAPAVTVICPPMLGARADDPDWIRHDEWRGGVASSCRLPGLLRQACASMGIGFIDGNDGAESSKRDPIHWRAEMHEIFGQFMAGELRSIAAVSRTSQ